MYSNPNKRWGHGIWIFKVSHNPNYFTSTPCKRSFISFCKYQHYIFFVYSQSVCPSVKEMTIMENRQFLGLNFTMMTATWHWLAGWLGGWCTVEPLHEAARLHLANVVPVAKDYGLHIDQLPLTIVGLKHSCTHWSLFLLIYFQFYSFRVRNTLYGTLHPKHSLQHILCFFIGKDSNNYQDLHVEAYSSRNPNHTALAQSLEQHKNCWIANSFRKVHHCCHLTHFQS